MNQSYAYIQDILKEVGEIRENSIVSRTIYNDERVKVVLFSFSKGQELSEHRSSMPAIVHILQGEATLTLGKDTKDAKEGSWVYMPPGLPHSVEAKSQLVMLLTLIK
ncbi:MAG: cupin [Deltaproteobacteria bacterium]|jgi:quercetin dioxygenase-like cupin family protein|nr:MAG: cupin [Deltaproteobacteria bacterium]